MMRGTTLPTVLLVAASVATANSALAAVHARSTSKKAKVNVPSRANEAVVLEDARSGTSIRFRETHARAVVGKVRRDGDVVFRGALPDADLVQRVLPHGVEDYAVYRSKPRREELVYDVDVRNVAGLRLVADTLEMLDRDGSPVFRVAPPYVVDATGRRIPAHLAVDGCAFDTNAQPPWDRAPTPPGASSCFLRVTWSGITYPAAVDPAWTTTGNTASIRSEHSATLLPSGRVLVTGGAAGELGPPPAEIFDEKANGGTGGFAVVGYTLAPRTRHSAVRLADGRVLLVGGAWNEPRAEIYDPAASGTTSPFSWSAAMAVARTDHTASLLASGKVLVAGGYDSTSTFLATAEIFDPAADGGAGAFVPTGSMGTARAWHSAAVLPSGKVIVAGGERRTTAASDVLASIEEFDPSANGGVGAFASAGSMSSPRAAPAAVVLAGGGVAFIGGYTPGYMTGPTSTPGANPTIEGGLGGYMSQGRIEHTATMLPSGTVLIVGGHDYQKFPLETELWDPATGQVTIGPTLHSTKVRHTATLLPNGHVVVIGGQVTEIYAGVFGDPCSTNDDCLSGACAAGTCTTSCVTWKDCMLDYFCNASSLCEKRRFLGEPCTTNAQCPGDHCVDGFCCNGACVAQCAACNVPGREGMCEPIAGPPRGTRTPCPTGPENDRCATATCDGIVAETCGALVGEDVACGSPACIDGRATAAGHCDGRGSCVRAPEVACAPFACGPTECASRCASDVDCAPGLACEPTSGTCGDAPIGAAEAAGCAVSTSSDSGDAADPIAWAVACVFATTLRRRSARRRRTSVADGREPSGSSHSKRGTARAMRDGHEDEGHVRFDDDSGVVRVPRMRR